MDNKDQQDDSFTARIDRAALTAAEYAKTETQDAWRDAIAALRAAAQAADAADVVNPGDDLREINTPALRALFIPSLQSNLESSARPAEDEDRMLARKTYVEGAIGAGRLFFAAAQRHEALPSIIVQLVGVFLSADAKQRRENATVDRRTRKVHLFALEKKVAHQLNTFRTGFRDRMPRLNRGTSEETDKVPIDVFYDLLIVPRQRDGEDYDDDEDRDRDTTSADPLEMPQSLRGYLLQLLVLHALRTASCIDSAMQELELLRKAPPAGQDDRMGAPPPENTWRLDSPWFSKGYQGPLLSEQRKPMRPFTILPSTRPSSGTTADQRVELQRQVFRPSHRLPTITIDEYLDKEKARGNIVSGGGPTQAAEATPREQRTLREEMDGTCDADEAREEARQEAIKWDEFKDSHRRGEGNRMNRG
ncbi:Type 2A phosphatase-associated protein 42 [Malassezia sp. CBS 17886]|nr:Type 2A phosphatase-associated protein 42 [Malassezia sp. CBS 17886]